MPNEFFDISTYDPNDERSQRALYNHLLPYLRAVVCRYVRNPSNTLDVLQESFIKIFRNIECFDPSKGELKPWCARIAINTAFNYNRKNKDVFVDVSELTARLSHPEVLDKMSHDDLLKILKAMPCKYFEVFNLYVIDGYSHEEIAEILKISVSSSRKRLSRSRQWIEKTLELEERKLVKYRFAAIKLS